MNMKLMSMALVLGLCATAQVFAGAQEPLYVVKSVEVQQSSDLVWQKIANFGDLGAWHPAVAKTEIIAGKNNHKGAKRLLTLQDGGKINETLTAYDAKAKTYAYKITDSVLPVSEYQSTITVHPNGATKSVVVWESHFVPKAGNDEQTAAGTINAVYDAGLSNLKKISE